MEVGSPGRLPLSILTLTSHCCAVRHVRLDIHHEAPIPSHHLQRMCVPCDSVGNNAIFGTMAVSVCDTVQQGSNITRYNCCTHRRVHCMLGSFIERRIGSGGDDGRREDSTPPSLGDKTFMPYRLRGRMRTRPQRKRYSECKYSKHNRVTVTRESAVCRNTNICAHAVEYSAEV